jgi:hydroxyacid-oxoacid transhydrogenase
MDTAKVANLYATHPTAHFLDYVNAPIGAGKPVPAPLKPLIAVPTTAGTGSEVTGVAVFDLLEKQVKTGISHRYLRPTMGIIDPLNAATMPALVAACSGLDVLCHAIESLTAVPFDKKMAAETPALRPTYQGANPISDIWSAKAIEIAGKYLLRAMHDAHDIEARGQMMLAAAMAGIGFGNAGVHLPHAMSYPVAGMVREYRPAEYGVDYALVPHGMAVILNAPAVFRWTADVNPQRHLEAVRLLGGAVHDISPEHAGTLLADSVIQLMQATHMPNGLAALGFTEADIPALADGALAQQRLTQLAPRPVNREDMLMLFQHALRSW